MEEVMRKVKFKFIFVGAAAISLFVAAGYLKTAGYAQTDDDNRPGIVIRGRVVSAYGLVENARVRVAGDENYTLTDRQGRYELITAPPPGTRITMHPPGTRLLVTAGKEGWFNNGQIANFSGRTRDIFLNPVYLDDRADYRFISTVTCAVCSS